MLDASDSRDARASVQLSIHKAAIVAAGGQPGPHQASQIPDCVDSAFLALARLAHQGESPARH
jgi:hypothetical protein